VKEDLSVYIIAMATGRGYDIFPRTFKARLLLAAGFAAGLAIMASWVAVLAFGSYGISELFENPPCTGSEREGCLEAQTELVPIAQAWCEGSDGASVSCLWAR
ncbi:hypothetical protein LCGC14_2666970, partial [marine sediment metagenome]